MDVLLTTSQTIEFLSSYASITINLIQLLQASNTQHGLPLILLVPYQRAQLFISMGLYNLGAVVVSNAAVGCRELASRSSAVFNSYITRIQVCFGNTKQ